MVTDKTFDEVYEGYRGLIWSLVHKRQSAKTNPRYDPEDLFQVACMALCKAYNNFDTNKEVNFATYLTKYVNGELSKYIIKNHSDFSIMSQSVWNDFSTLPATINLDGVAYDDDTVEVGDFIAFSDTNYNELSLWCNAVRSAINDERLYYIWHQHFILDRTYKDIAEELGISKQRVQQLIVEAQKRAQTKIKRSDFYD